jgi:Tfp pilus assembly protein PilF
LSDKIRTKRTVNVAAAVIVLPCASVTIHRSRDWRDDYSLYVSAVKNDASSAETHCSLGTALLQDKGDIEAARQEWEAALRIGPSTQIR